MNVTFSKLDLTEYLQTQDEQGAFLQDALESGDAGYVSHALGLIARAKNVETVAKEAGLSTSAVYKALGKEGNPTLTTLIRLMKPLGLKLVIQPA